MNQIILLSIGVIFLAVGAILGYYARQSIARRQVGTLEEKIQKKVSEAKNEAQSIVAEATEKASQVLGKVKKDIDQRQTGLLKTEQLLLKRENILDNKFSLFEKKEKEFQEKVQALKKIKQDIEGLRAKVTENLEKASKLSKEEAKKELFENLKKDYQAEILEKIR